MPEPVMDELLQLLSRTTRNMLLRNAERWAQLNVTMPQLKVLMLLGQHGGSPVSTLAGQMKVSPPNVTGILDRLEQHGWVQRTNDASDRRVVRIVLTEAGEKFLMDLHQSGQARLRSRLSQMSKADQKALLQGLSALDAIPAEDDEPAAVAGGQR